jgi:hypothetical protein
MAGGVGMFDRAGYGMSHLYMRIDQDSPYVVRWKERGKKPALGLSRVTRLKGKT